MRWIQDSTGQLRRRPFYDSRELDSLCEEVMVGFLSTKYGRVVFPISTDDLTVLVEKHVSSLDLYADLRDEGNDVQGMTVFMRNERPQVFISAILSEQHWRENRLRTTLTHELGHVLFHDRLWTRDQMSFLDEDKEPYNPRCERATILGAGKVDWMEWQAGYASGSILMPYGKLRETVQSFRASSNELKNIEVTTTKGQELIATIQEKFAVSEDAARVRLLQAHFLTKASSQTQFP